MSVHVAHTNTERVELYFVPLHNPIQEQIKIALKFNAFSLRNAHEKNDSYGLRFFLA